MVTVSIDLARIRQNAEAILRRTGVPLIAVVKADAYGLGAADVAGAIGDLVEAFYVFDQTEAIQARLWEITGRRIIALNTSGDADELLARHIQPVVWTMEQAQLLRRAHPVVSIDTGQQRFACPAGEALQICRAGACGEAMTHAVRLDQVDDLRNVVNGWTDQKLFLHAAGSALLNEPRAWLNAVRPGLMLYDGAVRVSAPFVEVRDSSGPAGYSGFIAPRFGIILAGYSNGLRPGPCRVNGQLRKVLEVGMQSAFVEANARDRRGDQVELLSNEPGIDLPSVAAAWRCSSQEVLVRLCGLRQRSNQNR